MTTIYIVEEVDRGAIAAYTNEEKARSELIRLIKLDQERYNADVQSAHDRNELYPHILRQKEYRYWSVELVE